MPKLKKKNFWISTNVHWQSVMHVPLINCHLHHIKHCEKLLFQIYTSVYWWLPLAPKQFSWSERKWVCQHIHCDPITSFYETQKSEHRSVVHLLFPCLWMNGFHKTVHAYVQSSFIICLVRITKRGWLPLRCDGRLNPCHGWIDECAEGSIDCGAQ